MAHPSRAILADPGLDAKVQGPQDAGFVTGAAFNLDGGGLARL